MAERLSCRTSAISPHTATTFRRTASYQPIDHVQIELYTKDKNPEAEGMVESALSSLFWEKSETYIDTEKCYQILYEVEV